MLKLLSVAFLEFEIDSYNLLSQYQQNWRICYHLHFKSLSEPLPSKVKSRGRIKSNNTQDQLVKLIINLKHVDFLSNIDFKFVFYYSISTLLKPIENRIFFSEQSIEFFTFLKISEECQITVQICCLYEMIDLLLHF